MWLPATALVVLYYMLGSISTTQATAVQLSALDCSKPKFKSNLLLHKLCTVDSAVNDGRKQEVTLLQSANEYQISGYRCTRIQSVFTKICGMFSHLKDFESPLIEIPAGLTASECQQLVERGSYVRNDGYTESVPMNTWVYFSYVRQGKLITSTSNVRCEGASFVLNGGPVSGLVQMVSEKIIVQEIYFEVSQGRIKDLDNQFILPTSCYGESHCDSGLHTYVFEERATKCNLFKVRDLPMSMTNVETDSGMVRALINHEHKIFLVLKGREPVLNECGNVNSVYFTQYHEVKVLLNEELSGGSKLKNVQAQVLDISLELKMTSEYLEYQSDEIMKQRFRKLSRKLCDINRHSLHDVQLSPFHANTILQIRGDLISELTCSEVTVTAHIGEQRSKYCHIDALPVFLAGRPVYIQSRTHIIVTGDDSTRTPCDKKLLPIFSSRNGTEFLIAAPQVQRIDIKLSDSESFVNMFDDKRPIQPHYGMELFYTADEINSWNQILHWGASKKAIINQLVDNYCLEAGCRNYNSDKARAGLDLADIEAEISPWKLMENFFDLLKPIGGICSIIVLSIFLISTLYKCWRIASLNCVHKMPIRQAAQLTLNCNTFIADLYLQNRNRGMNLNRGSSAEISHETALLRGRNGRSRTNIDYISARRSLGIQGSLPHALRYQNEQE